MYDLIIIGAGPAGITAAVYAARKKMRVLVISPDIGGQAAWSGEIENYTGYQFISGPDLAKKFEEHMRKYNMELIDNKKADGIIREGKKIVVMVSKDRYEASAAIIATGKRTRELNIPGEKEFKNHGLTYCATCDGPLFQGKDVAVIGGGNSALDAVLQLTRIARQVYLINISADLNGDEIMIQKVKEAKNVTIHNNSQARFISGDKFVKALTIEERGKEKQLSLEGIFVEIGLIPNSEFAKDVKKNVRAEIIINSKNETSVPGIFAAGDVTDVPEKQIIIAAGEGSKAALGAFRYISQNRF